MFNINSQCFSICNNTPPASGVEHLTIVLLHIIPVHIMVLW